MSKPQLDQSQFAVLAVTLLASIGTHLDHLPAWLTPALALLIAARVLMRRRRLGKLPAWLRLPLTAGLLIGIILSFGTVLGRDAGSAFGCGLLALKLLETETPRDARVALGFCAFVLMSALLFGQSLLFTLGVCSVLVLLVAVLNRLEPAPLPTARPLRTSLSLALQLIAVALPLALASFVLVPRLATPLWGAPNAGAHATTGLSETMAPGQFTDLMSDDTPAMRVSFEGRVPPPSAQYFRTLVLSDFDGTTWTRARTGLKHDAEPARGTRTPWIDTTVTLEATQQRWLPALDTPITAPQGAFLTDDDVLVASQPVSHLLEYRVRSRLGPEGAGRLERFERQRLLRLPEGVGAQARELAARWRRESPGDAEVVQQALAMFHSSFHYTLSPPLLGRDSIDEFLFDTREGFCEHYASAFVFLMRAAGIPARVVTGYQGGWWSDSGAYLLVRQSDAHAWAEIWRDGVGWIRVDPTAAVAPARIEQGAAQVNDAASWAQGEWLRALRNQFDIVNRLWTQGVVRFDALRQRAVLTEFGLADRVNGNLLLMLAGVLTLMLLLATWWAMRDPPIPQGDALDRLWHRLRRTLSKAEIELAPSDGPLGLQQRVAVQDAELGRSLQPLTDRYARLRYAMAQPPADEVEALRREALVWSRRRLRRRIVQARLRKIASVFDAGRFTRGSP